MSNLRCALIILALSLPASAQTYFAFNGQCAKGGQEVLVQNQPSKGTVPIGGTLRTLTSGVIGSYPGCIVRVLQTGTPTLATIYSSVTGTPLANPFTANTDGSFLFFAGAAGYDVAMSGAGLPATVTLTDIQLGAAGAPSGITLSTNGVLNGSQTLLNLAQGANIAVVDNGQGTDTISVNGVITGIVPNYGLSQTGTGLGISPCPSGKTQVSNGSGYVCGTAGGGPVIQTNGTNNVIQSQLNLLAGAGISITDNGAGTDIFNVLSVLSSSTFAMPYYSSPTVISGVAAPTSPNGVPQIFTSTPSGGNAQQGAWNPPGVAGRAVTGTTATDTILSSDCSPNRIEYTGSVAVAVTLPTATTLAVPNCVFKISNQTSPSQTVTVTPSTWTVNGAATLAIPSGSVATFYVDPLGTNWNADVPASASSALTGSGTNNTMTKWTGTSALGNSQVIDDGTHPTQSPLGFNVHTGGGYDFDLANNAATGTTAQTATCDDGTGLGIVCSHTTSTTNQPIGFVVSGAGTTGNATLCNLGWCVVKFDNSTTAKHYAIASTSVDGELHDSGTALTAGQPNYLIWTANGGVGNPGQVRLLTADDFTNAAVSVYKVQVAGTTLTAGDTVNFNATTPVVGANGFLVIPQTSKSGTTDSVSFAAPVQYAKGSCTEVWGGSGAAFALTAGDDSVANNSCYNDSGVTRTITAVKCRSDNGSNTTTVNPTFGSAGTGTTILSGALTCGNSYAYSSTGTVSNASWTTGTGITPAMSGTLTGTSVAMIVEYTY